MTAGHTDHTNFAAACPFCTDADTDNPMVLKMRIAALRADLAAARALLRDAQPLAAATLNAALRWNDHNYDNDTPIFRSLTDLDVVAKGYRFVECEALLDVETWTWKERV